MTVAVNVTRQDNIQPQSDPPTSTKALNGEMATIVLFHANTDDNRLRSGLAVER